MWKVWIEIARLEIWTQEREWWSGRTILRNVHQIWKINQRIEDTNKSERKRYAKSKRRTIWSWTEIVNKAKWAEDDAIINASLANQIWGVYGGAGIESRWTYQNYQQIGPECDGRPWKTNWRFEKWEFGFEGSHQRKQEGEVHTQQRLEPVDESRLFVAAEL